MGRCDCRFDRAAVLPGYSPTRGLSLAVLDEPLPGVSSSSVVTASRGPCESHPEVLCRWSVGSPLWERVGITLHFWQALVAVLANDSRGWITAHRDQNPAEGRRTQEQSRGDKGTPTHSRSHSPPNCGLTGRICSVLPTPLREVGAACSSVTASEWGAVFRSVPPCSSLAVSGRGPCDSQCESGIVPGQGHIVWAARCSWPRPPPCSRATDRAPHP